MRGGHPRAGVTRPERENVPEGFGLPKLARIRGGEEIRTVFKRGRRKRTDHLDVFFLASPVSRPRWGVVVPKHGRTAVDRNLLKRRLRHLGRTDVLPRLWEGRHDLDVLVRARKEAYGLSFAQLQVELVTAMEKVCSESSSSD